MMVDGTRVMRDRGTPQGGVVTPLTQKVTLTAPRFLRLPLRRLAAILWRSGRYGDAMTDCDGLVADQDLFDHEPYDPLALGNIKCVGSAA